jgi:hypothetical protein
LNVVDVLTVEEQNIVILNWQRPLWEGDQEIAKMIKMKQCGLQYTSAWKQC